MSKLKESTKLAIMNSTKIWVSHPTGKMQGIPAITESCKANPFCKKMSESEECVCHKCYAQNSLGYEEGARLHYNRNTELLSHGIIDNIDLPHVNAYFARFETHGDWVNEYSAINEMRIASKNYNCDFTVWTKRVDILRKIAMNYCQPDNFHVKLSSPMLNVELSQNIKTWFRENGWSVTFFTVCSLDYLIEKYGLKYLQQNGDKVITCGGRSCMNCMKCYGVRPNEDVIELLKQDVSRAKKLGIKIG